ncbi:MAG: ABC transporter substrate-binding protein [Candidatus Bathyarchaeia archaeon]
MESKIESYVKTKKVLIYILLPIIINPLLTSSITVYSQYQPPHTEPGPAVDRLRFKAFAQDIAPAALEKGDIDLYLYTLRTAMVKELANKPGINLYRAPSTSIAILLNPSPAPEGELNPLAIREVRFALQYVVNRDYVANEIYKGMAMPMFAHVSSFDLDYLTVYDIIKRHDFHYDPDLAKELISDALTKVGATLKDGKWFYKGEPIRLKFVIRVEDERREVGDLVASELTKLGFTVERVYQTFGPAILRVYGTDPKAFEWHLYTEGWGKTTVDKYDYATINQMYAPWFGNMPGWQEVGYWQYEHPELDAICKKVFRGEFTSIEERNELYRQATDIGMRESIRLWVVTVINNFPATSDLEGVTLELVGGPRSPWTLREAYVPGKCELTVGHLWVWTERSIWNPIGGFGDVYSVDVWRNIYDPPIWRHPFTGIPMPFRAEYAVETAGPLGKISLPENAFTWDPSTRVWVTVAMGTKATSKVTFNYAKYIGSKWHHDQMITMADIIYPIYQAFDLAYNPDKSRIEYAIASVSRPYLEVFRGFNIVNSTTIEIYLDYWHFDQNYIAEYASLAGVSMPWEVLHAMDTLVFERRRAAYSDTAAARFNVPWLSLVEQKHALLIKGVLADFLVDDVLPEWMGTS